MYKKLVKHSISHKITHQALYNHILSYIKRQQWSKEKGKEKLLTFSNPNNSPINMYLHVLVQVKSLYYERDRTKEEG